MLFRKNFKDVYLVTFATEDFEKYQNDLIKSGRKYGIVNQHRYTQSDLVGTPFYENNSHIFQYKRGFGLWVWKPFFILQSLERIQENEIVFYVDSGAMFMNDPAALIRLAKTNDTGLVAFSHRPVLIREFCKRDTFINMNCDSPEYWNAYKIMAGINLFRKNDFTLKFVREWLAECQNLDSLADSPNKAGKENFPDFKAHREDQSIFSILIKKHSVFTYRDPSKWGNFLKLPQFRHPGELVCYPWLLNDSITTYSETPDTTSKYDTVFELNRKTAGPQSIPKPSLLGKMQSILSRIRSRFGATN